MYTTIFVNLHRFWTFVYCSVRGERSSVSQSTAVQLYCIVFRVCSVTVVTDSQSVLRYSCSI